MLPADFINDTQSQVGCEIRTDDVTKLLYSTDASIYQIEPMGVAYPRTQDELAAICEISYLHKIPILPRGSGSSLAGQAIGPALILDCSRHLNRIVNIDQEQKTAIVEPGLILSQLNKTLSKLGLQFGPDPASAERATMGGSLANNATGAHSIQYGMAVDHLLDVEVVLSDGSFARFKDISIEKATKIAFGNGIESDLYKMAMKIRNEFSDEIIDKWPKTWRRVSGYNLNYLIPWSMSRPPNWYLNNGNLLDETGQRIDDRYNQYPPGSRGTLNLAKLIAGSEGTLAVIKNATINLVDQPKYTILGVLAYQNIAQACDDVPDLLLHCPSAIELIPNTLITLAKSIPAYAHQLGFIDELLQHNSGKLALLVVEFSGDDLDLLDEKAIRLGRNVIIARSNADQQKIWGIRKVGLGILMSRPGDIKPISIIEDTAVPVDQLGVFVREMEKIMTEHDTEADFYAHASAGCLHIRPLINIKQADGRRKLRSIAEATVDLTLRLGGAMSAEHGDGLARSEWLEKAYGPKILSAFRMIKDAADPDNRLNPGNIIDPQPMDKNLRVIPDEHPIIEWRTVMNFAPKNVQTSSLGVMESIELCNGAGVCRKLDGVMCPSFQATSDEMQSTRGRANLLRAMLLDRYKSKDLGAKAVFDALDLCLACKGCKAECPSAVDMAKLKYEYLHLYYQQFKNQRKLRDYIFGFIGNLAKAGSIFSTLSNYVLRQDLIKRAGERYLGISAKRDLPFLSRRSLSKKISRLSQPTGESIEIVFFLSDPFTEYFFTDTGLAAIQVLRAAGCQVIILPILGSGRTLISKGFLEHARTHAEHFMKVIKRLDPQGEINIIGVEPSEIYTLRDEFIDLLPRDKDTLGLASRAFMIDEFLIRPNQRGDIRIDKVLESSQRSPQPIDILLHGHCYQKSQSPAADGRPFGVHATKAMLERANFRIKLIEAGCCGMAGAFGYEVEHYEISMKIGEYGVFPAIRTAKENLGENIAITAPGISCRSHINEGTGYEAIHPIELIYNQLFFKE